MLSAKTRLIEGLESDASLGHLSGDAEIERSPTRPQNKSRLGSQNCDRATRLSFSFSSRPEAGRTEHAEPISTIMAG